MAAVAELQGRIVVDPHFLVGTIVYATFALAKSVESYFFLEISELF